MKKLAMAMLALLMCFGLSTCIRVARPEPDWLPILTEAAAAGDRETGRKAAEAWNAGEGHKTLDYDELVLLAKLITWEAGSPWLNDVVRMSVGEVALNRVASPEFPDTLEEVLLQEGEYPEAGVPELWDQLIPTVPCVQAALRLLLGERVLQPQVVYQTHSPRGKIHAVYSDLRLGFTYFCESEHPELYGSLPTDTDALSMQLQAAIRNGLGRMRSHT